MNISPDQNVIWRFGFININYTLIFSWIVMLFLTILAYLTRCEMLKMDKNKVGKLENFFEVLISAIEKQIKNISTTDFKLVFPVITTLFIYIFTSNITSIIPWFEPPTSSLSTTVALMIIVVVFGIYIGIKNKGFRGYFLKYIQPVVFMLPLNIIGDIVSNFSMAFRLYGNVMSGGVVGKILSSIPFLSVGLPIVINLLGIITGVIQAYIFSVLAMIFIA